jgi:hypothetical protein
MPPMVECGAIADRRPGVVLAQRRRRRARLPGSRGRHPLESLAQCLCPHLAVDQQHVARAVGALFEKARADRDRIGDAEREHALEFRYLLRSVAIGMMKSQHNDN